MWTDHIKSLCLWVEWPVHLREGLGRVHWSTPPGDAVQEGVVYGGVVAAVAKHAPHPLGQLLLKQITSLRKTVYFINLKNIRNFLISENKSTNSHHKKTINSFTHVADLPTNIKTHIKTNIQTIIQNYVILIPFKSHTPP